LSTAAWISLWMSATLKMVFFCATCDLIYDHINSVGLWQSYGYNCSSLCPCCWAVGCNSWFLYCGLYALTSCSNSMSLCETCVLCLLDNMPWEKLLFVQVGNLSRSLI
jgi:hypothetical protein